MSFITKSLTAFVGLSVCGVSGYLLYLLYRRDDDDDLTDVYARSNFNTLEIKVKKDMVRALIGRNGKQIKDIQEQSNTRINFKDQHGIEEKICVIRGSFESCNIAENLILDFINNQPVVESEDIWIPVTCVGKVIGRCGDKISEIRSLSSAKVTVNDNEQSLSTKRVTITGTKEQISVAKSLIEDIVEQAQQIQQVLEATLAKREPRLPPKSPDCRRKVDSPKVERLSPVPPGQPDTQFDVYVSGMVDPSKFWVQLVGPKATELDSLVDEMTEYYNNEENRNLHVLNSIKEGDLVAALFKFDDQWYRGEVLHLIEEDGEKRAELFYVDYGDCETLPVTDLYDLRTDFLKLHFQAIECYLARVDPVEETWSEEAIDQFEILSQLAQWEKLSARVNGYTLREKKRAKREISPVPGVDLFDISNEEDIDVAEELVKAGLAVYKKAENSRATSVSNLSTASSSPGKHLSNGDCEGVSEDTETDN